MTFELIWKNQWGIEFGDNLSEPHKLHDVYQQNCALGLSPSSKSPPSAIYFKVAASLCENLQLKISF